MINAIKMPGVQFVTRSDIPQNVAILVQVADSLLQEKMQNGCTDANVTITEIANNAVEKELVNVNVIFTSVTQKKKLLIRK
jgi:hypothetical protein